jgi:O-methyltransferase involved in polyketide biosynthesis
LKFSLEKIPETLLLPLWGRAMMSQSKHSFLGDKYAASLITRLDYDFSHIKATLKPVHALIWEARAWQLDRLVREFLQSRPKATVVNLGAGLDTTFQRIDNGLLKWVDVDLPEVIEIRRRLIPESDRSRCFAGSLFEQAWIDGLGDISEGVMAICAGCLFYFPEERIKPFFGMLGRKLDGGVIAFDTMTPKAARKASRMVSDADMSGTVRWAMKDSRVMESWGEGISICKDFGFFKDVPKRGFPLIGRLLMSVSDMKGLMRIVECRVGR